MAQICHLKAVAAPRLVPPRKVLLAAHPAGENYKRVLRYSLSRQITSPLHLFLAVAAPLLARPRKESLAVPLDGKIQINIAIYSIMLICFSHNCIIYPAAAAKLLVRPRRVLLAVPLGGKRQHGLLVLVLLD